MKKLLPFIILIFAIGILAQVKTDNPRTVYNKNITRLVGVYDLVDCSKNGKKNFTGTISRVLLNSEYSEYYFDIRNETFEFDYTNLSNVDRSYLSGLIKKRNRVSIFACAGGSNGVWHIINMKLK
jgi:hypothetical protein